MVSLMPLCKSAEGQFSKVRFACCFLMLVGMSYAAMRLSNVAAWSGRCLPAHHRMNTQFKSFVNTAFKPLMYSPHRAMFFANVSNK